MEADTIRDMALGDNISALRQRKRMARKDLAKLLKISVQTISHWENNRTGVSMPHRIELCQLFGVTLEELASRRLPPEPIAEEKPTDIIVNQKGEEMVEVNTSLAAIRTILSILLPNLAPEKVQALASVFLSLALNPPASASGASYEDRLRDLYQGALAARSVEQ